MGMFLEVPRREREGREKQRVRDRETGKETGETEPEIRRQEQGWER